MNDLVPKSVDATTMTHCPKCGTPFKDFKPSPHGGTLCPCGKFGTTKLTLEYETMADPEDCVGEFM